MLRTKSKLYLKKENGYVYRVRSVPMMSDTDVRKTLDIKPKERLEHFLEKLMDTIEYASVVGAAIFISTAV